MSNILQAREERANHITKLMKEYDDFSIVVLKKNVAGIDKNPAHMMFVCAFFDQLIKETFSTKVMYFEKRGSLDGDYCIYIINETGNLIKEKTIELEERNALGRLVDIDVYYKKPISRQDLECEMRKCLICENYAHLCTRNQTHSIEEIHQKTFEIASEFLVDYLLNTTIKAIYGELEVYPKFGLVSHRDSGCHKDMDYETFIKSTFAIKRYIEKYIREGINKTPNPQRLKEIGLKAESRMFKATKNVNTHKGLVFLLGIFLPAFSETIINNENKDYLVQRIKKISQAIIGDYFETINKKETLSHGDKIFLDYGLKGVRGEALKGLEIILDSPSGNNDEDTSFHNYLIYFMSKLDDTTIIHKTDMETLRQVQEDMNQIIENGGYRKNLKEVYNLSDQYKEKNISPGGSADMLVIKIIYEELKYLLNKESEDN